MKRKNKIKSTINDLDTETISLEKVVMKLTIAINENDQYELESKHS